VKWRINGGDVLSILISMAYLSYLSTHVFGCCEGGGGDEAASEKTRTARRLAAAASRRDGYYQWRGLKSLKLRESLAVVCIREENCGD